MLMGFLILERARPTIDYVFYGDENYEKTFVYLITSY